MAILPEGLTISIGCQSACWNYCANCGQKVRDTQWKHCPQCGAKIGSQPSGSGPLPRKVVEDMRRIMDEIQVMRHTPGTPYDDIMRRFVDLVETFVRGLEKEAERA